MKYEDIYFTSEYGKLYELVEKGTLETFEYKTDKGSIRNQFIKRKIPVDIGDKTYYDIITPYGYGGPIIINCKDGDKDELVREYYKSFECYCRKNNIVSEFIRFHPILKNHKDFAGVYEIEFIRNTLATNIKDYEDPIQSEFSKSCRKKIRQGINKGLKAELDFECKSIENFMKIYYSTMDRNNATDYYYFDRKYFYDMVSGLKENLMIINIKLEDKIIAAGLYMKYSHFLHAHLSGTLSEYLSISPANMIRYEAVKWGKENDIYYLHHGGGTSNSIEDGLYKFKKGFSQHTEFQFYVSKKIWDIEIYNELLELVSKQKELNYDFFPTYRS